MSPSTQSGSKQKSIPFHAYHLHHQRQVIAAHNANLERERSANRDSNSDSNDNNDGKTRASVTSSRRSNGHSRAMAAVLESIQKNPPSAQLPHNTTDNANCSRRNSSITSIHTPRNTTGWSVTNVENPEPVSPPFASLPTASPPGILPSPSAGNSTTTQHSPHAIAVILAHELLDDALSLSVTEHDNETIEPILSEFGTVRNNKEHHRGERSNNIQDFYPV